MFIFIIFTKTRKQISFKSETVLITENLHFWYEHKDNTHPLNEFEGQSYNDYFYCLLL